MTNTSSSTYFHMKIFVPVKQKWFFLHSSWTQTILAGKSIRFVFKLGFTPCKAEQRLRGMELQEKKTEKDCSIQEICLERTYS